MPFRTLKLFYFSLFGVLLLLGILILGQRIYYQAKIPNWNKEELLRQSLFSFSNRPHFPYESQHTGIEDIKRSFVHSWFVYDTSFIKSDDIKAAANQTVTNRFIYTADNSSIIYWFFQNNRVYMLLALSFLINLVARRKYNLLIKWLVVLLGYCSLLFYFLFFMKITDGMFLCIVGVIFFAACIDFQMQLLPKRILDRICLCMLLASCLWVAVNSCTC